MQHKLDKTLAKFDELMAALKGIMASLQDQQRSVTRLIDRSDEAARDNEAAVQRVCRAAETMEENTHMIVRATLIAAHSLSEPKLYAQAKKLADMEMAEWTHERQLKRA